MSMLHKFRKEIFKSFVISIIVMNALISYLFIYLFTHSFIHSFIHSFLTLITQYETFRTYDVGKNFLI